MDRSNVLDLLVPTFAEDSIGQKIPTVKKRTIFCDVTSVSRSEWFEAGRNGIKPEYRFVVNRYDYNGETECEFEGNRYGIYRTFAGRNDDLELYVEKKAGVQ